MDLEYLYKYSENFSEEERELAINFIAEAIISFVSISAKYKVAEMIEQWKDKRIEIGPEDKVSFTFTINTIGNDIVTALGAANKGK